MSFFMKNNLKKRCVIMAYKLKSYHEIILFVRASFLLQLSTEV